MLISYANVIRSYVHWWWATQELKVLQIPNTTFIWKEDPDSKVHGTNMGPIWVLSAPDGPHVGSLNLAIWGLLLWNAKKDFDARYHRIYEYNKITSTQPIRKSRHGKSVENIAASLKFPKSILSRFSDSWVKTQQQTNTSFHLDIFCI